MIYIQQRLAGNFDAATKILDTSIEYLEKNGLHSLVASHLVLKAEAMLKAKHYQSACDLFEKAAEALEKYSADMEKVEGIGVLQEATASLYSFWAEGLVGLGRKEEALIAVDRGRGQSQRHKSIRQGYNIPAQNILDKSMLASLTSLRSDTLFLHYNFADNDRGSLFAFSAQDPLQVFPFSGMDALRPRIQGWRTVILPPKDLRDADDYQNKEIGYAKELYGKLLGEVEKSGMLRRGRNKRIIILPDGPLWNVPFMALMNSQGRRIIDDFAVSIASSLYSLRAVKSLSSAKPAKNLPADYSLLYVADPLGSAGNKEVQGNIALDTFGPVPFLGREIPVLGKTVPRSVGLVYRNATRSKVSQLLPKSNVFLFGGHGDINEKDERTDSGLLSALILADEGGNTAKIVRFTGYDIMKLPLKMQLTILLACHTGEGRSAGGEGLFGLVWAFQIAGCESVLASQWRVIDRPSFALVEVFWRELQQGKPKDDALRIAINTVRANPNWNAPYFWSAFQIYGTTQPLKIF